ncbi:hypothetical protein GCM10023081_42980 [Arthrobacter ginkgonis]|uniref:Uncharacterized protein n=1 Tax=Arthrobacter ginkgonis TaxID=1630594 RepID=A0ABP7DB97_9MICC
MFFKLCVGSPLVPATFSLAALLCRGPVALVRCAILGIFEVIDASFSLDIVLGAIAILIAWSLGVIVAVPILAALFSSIARNQRVAAEELNDEFATTK